ncbi:MAG: serine/threonine-protein kinase, partial [Verrucomicrobiales bacterium]
MGRYCLPCLLRPAQRWVETNAEALPAEDATGSSTEFLVGGRIGPYDLEAQIGAGGFSTVWRAAQRVPIRRSVALKILRPGMDTGEFLARFEQERQALALMEHPHIARVLDAGTSPGGRPYLVMELVAGVPITEYCDANQLTIRERLQLVVRVCGALQHAHQKGIIHRDLKPSNILVSLGQDGIAVPKIIDFGIAKAMDGPLTDSTLYTHCDRIIGTPAYMSPEQADAGASDLDTRSDIYGIGALLYELLIGRPPFDPRQLGVRGGTDVLLRTMRETEPVRPSARLLSLSGVERNAVVANRGSDAVSLARLLRGDLDWIVMKCLEKDRERRYASANGLGMDIERSLANEAIVARPPSTAYKIQKTWRRNKLAFLAAALIMLALMAGIVGVIFVQFRANEDYRQRLYVSEVNRAGIAWQSGQSSGLREALERCPAGLRGWEWNYLQQQVDRWEALVVLATKGETWSGLSVDGNLVAVNAADVIRIRNLSGGRWLRDIP